MPAGLDSHRRKETMKIVKTAMILASGLEYVGHNRGPRRNRLRCSVLGKRPRYPVARQPPDFSPEGQYRQRLQPGQLRRQWVLEKRIGAFHRESVLGRAARGQPVRSAR